VAQGLIRLNNEEFHDMYASTNIIRVIISRKLRFSEHVALMRDMRNA
jgi:hypothetical protein